MKVRKKIVTEKILKEIVRRIVAAVQPEKIILFEEEMGTGCFLPGLEGLKKVEIGAALKCS